MLQPVSDTRYSRMTSRGSDEYLLAEEGVLNQEMFRSLKINRGSLNRTHKWYGLLGTSSKTRRNHHHSPTFLSSVKILKWVPSHGSYFKEWSLILKIFHYPLLLRHLRSVSFHMHTGLLECIALVRMLRENAAEKYPLHLALFLISYSLYQDTNWLCPPHWNAPKIYPVALIVISLTWNCWPQSGSHKIDFSDWSHAI